MNFHFRQKAISTSLIPKLLLTCSKMPPKEVFVTSLTGAMSRYDLSRCKILKDPLLINQLVLFFRKNHFLMDSIDDVMGIFKASGLIDFWISKYVKKKKAEFDNAPKVLTVYNLSGIFTILIIGLLSSFLCFFFESCFYKIHHCYSCTMWKAVNNLSFD